MLLTSTLPDSVLSLNNWFRKRGFRIANFQGKKKLLISTFDSGQTLVFALHERPGYTTFLKEASGGALIVFEVQNQGDKTSYFGYCPILLFGIWSQKLSFKKNSVLLGYRAEGYELEQEFRSWFQNKF